MCKYFIFRNIKPSHHNMNDTDRCHYHAVQYDYDIAYSISMTEAVCIRVKLTNVAQYLTIMGKQWGIYCEVVDIIYRVITALDCNWHRQLSPWEDKSINKRTRQIWGIWKLRPAYSPETPNLGQNRWCFVPCDLEILWMTLENNRASLLCCFKLCATFHSH